MRKWNYGHSDEFENRLFDWAGLGISPLDYIDKNFGYLLGSGDIKKVYDTHEQQYVWNFSPTAVQAISAMLLTLQLTLLGN
jgi:hypothetical protein